MKSNRVEWWLLITPELIIASIMMLVALSTLPFIAYQERREKEEDEYRRVLDRRLEKPYQLNLDQIRGGLAQWVEGYKELKVPGSYTNVYKKVESILTEATALSERVPTMSAPTYLKDLESLQGKVGSVPGVGAQLYKERNPWLSGFLFFLIIGGVKAVGLFLLCMAPFAGVMYLFKRVESTYAPPSSSNTSTTSSGGGGSDG